MPGEDMTSTKQKHNDSDAPESAESAHYHDNDRRVATSSIEGKQLQTQEEHRSESPRITLRGLPTDVWWTVIDKLEDDLNALAACALVCRGWTEICRRLLGKPIEFHSLSDLRQTAKRGHSESGQVVRSCRGVSIEPYSFYDLRMPSLFAIMFAGKMPLLRTLAVRGEYGGVQSSGAEWKPGEMHADMFLYLSTFTSIAHLTLSSITFPSVQTFGRLLSAIPSLKTLRCDRIESRAHILRPGAFLRRPRNLTSLDLSISDLATMHDVCDFLVATEMASTLKEIIIRERILMKQLDKSGIAALLSSAGASLDSMYLTLKTDTLPGARRAPVINFSKLTNLKRVSFVILDSGPHSLSLVIPWMCDRLAELPKSSIMLRNLTLRLPLATLALPNSNVALHRLYMQRCKLLDGLLSTPPFMGLEQFIFEIKSAKLKALDKVDLKELASTSFPKSVARGIFRVVVLDDVPGIPGITEKRDEDGYSITDLIW